MLHTARLIQSESPYAAFEGKIYTMEKEGIYYG